MIALIVMTDGRREYLTQTLAGIDANLVGPITTRVIYDDSGDADHRDWLLKTFPLYDVWWHHERLGFAGAYRSMWSSLRGYGREPFIFSIEDDIVITRPVNLLELATVLAGRPHLAQMALRRQPWNDTERAAGGVVEANPDGYQEMTNGPDTWLEHRLFWTTNASLYRRDLVDRYDWPEGPESEGHFSATLFADPVVRSGYWGARDSGAWVEHIGTERVGSGY